MNFVHTADLHLGYRQYDLDQRFRDLGGTFLKVVEYAIAREAEFVLIAGDLFNARNINAPTFMQAHAVLSRLKEAGIPCIAIAGNHDRPFVRDQVSWLGALEQQGLLKFIKPWEEAQRANYVDVGGTRIFGMNYAGSATAAGIEHVAGIIREVGAARPAERTILMMHTGVEGQAKGNIIGETAFNDLAKLKGLVDYLALGHYHNAFALDGWIYNPGAPDTISLAEVGEPKGFYHVRDGKAVLIDQEVGRRPFLPFRMKLDGHPDAASLLRALEDEIAARGRPDVPPVVIVSFYGSPGFDRSHIDVERVKQSVTAALDPLYVDVRFDLAGDPFCIAESLDAKGFDRVAIEREVLSRRAAADSVLAGYNHYYAAVLSEVKDLAVRGADAETLDVRMRKAFEDIRDKRAPATEPAPPAAEAGDGPVPEKAAPPAAKPKPARQKRKPARPRAEPPEAESAPKVSEPKAPLPKVPRRTLSEYWEGKP
ncbi:MAG TPA: exonuclease SbcCD subunit D [Methanocella sp.]|nr:exonuclease SbcCD subunit D [Methanocella sp.]